MTASASSLPELGSRQSPSPRSPGLPPPSTPHTDGGAQTPTRTGSSASLSSLWAASSPIRKTVSLSSLSRKMRTKHQHGRPPLPDIVAVLTKPAAPEVDTRRLIGVLEDAVARLDRMNNAAERNQAWAHSTRLRERALEQAACVGVATAVSSSAALVFHLSVPASLALLCCSLAVAFAAVARRQQQQSTESLPAPLVDDFASLRRQLDDEAKKCSRAMDDDDDALESASARAEIDAAAADETARLRGMTFNCFSNIPTLNFERDVLAKLDAAEQAAFHEFTAKFERHLPSLGALRDDQVPDAYNRLRFLQADQYKVDEAVARLTRTVLWRRDNLDAFILSPNQSLLQRCRGLRPRVWCGFDRQGRPVMFEKLGLFFGSDEAYKGMSMEHWVKGYSYEICELMQLFQENTARTGVYQHGIAYVGDLAGLRVMTALRMIPFLKALVHEVEAFFPELAGKVFLINGPSFLPRLWTIVKRFLDPITVSKIGIINGSGRAELIDAFGAQVVPVEYGGLNPIVVPAPPVVVDGAFNKLCPPVTGVVL